MMNKKIKLINLGFKDYKEIWDYQTKLFQEIVDIKIGNRQGKHNEITPNYILFVEHPHVYTLGKSGKFSNLLVRESELEEKGVKFYKINRGGDITYHGPGQQVVYPILDLDNFFTDINKYLRLLEQVIILTLGEYDIKAKRSQGETGVWIDYSQDIFARKVCAMGIKSSRWVTMHGFALNVNTDLRYFDYIIPCGIKEKSVTSMHIELGKELDIQEVRNKVIKHFQHLFKAEITIN